MEYEDESIVVINKSRFTHCVAGRSTAAVNCFIEKHFPECKGIGGLQGEAGLTNRLDFETSGIVVVAKSTAIWQDWCSSFRQGEVQKEYLALVQGYFRTKQQVRSFLGSRYRGSGKVTVSTTPKSRFLEATSMLYPVASSSAKDISLIRVVTNSGRRHQVRVHCAEIGFPLSGDTLYCKPPFDKPPFDELQIENGTNSFFLHAWKISRGTFELKAHLPADFIEILQRYNLESPEIE